MAATPFMPIASVVITPLKPISLRSRSVTIRREIEAGRSDGSRRGIDAVAGHDARQPRVDQRAVRRQFQVPQPLAAGPVDVGAVVHVDRRIAPAREVLAGRDDPLVMERPQLREAELDAQVAHRR